MLPLPSLDEARALGATLRMIDPSLLKPVPYLRQWWKGGEAYLDATVDEDDAGVVLIEVYVRGRYARWTRARGLETGSTDEGAVGDGVPASRSESRDRAPDGVVVDVVHALVESCTGLAPHARFFARSPAA